MEPSSQNRTRKFLNLLKQAQNQAFVSLISDNLNIQLQNKPTSLIKLMNFMLNDLTQSKDDFIRLKINECLINTTLNEFMKNNFGQNIVDSLLNNKLNNENEEYKKKSLEKFQNCFLCLNLSEYQQLQTNRQMMEGMQDHNKEEKLVSQSFSDIVQGNKRFFNELIYQYQTLLSEQEINSQSNAQIQTNIAQSQQLNKEQLKEQVKNQLNTFGAKNLKLSDFIDENFFEDSDAKEEELLNKNQKQKLLVQSLFVLSNLNNSPQQYIIELDVSQKRQKVNNDRNGFVSPSYIIMSPVLAFLIECNQRILSMNWKERQSSVSIIKNILRLKDLNTYLWYKTIGINQQTQQYIVTKTEQASFQLILKVVFARLIILMLKDDFKDFQEHKLQVPVRDEGLQLLLQLQHYLQDEYLKKDFDFILQNLPLILIASEQNSWGTKYNFFLIVKGLLLSQKEEIFQRFHKVLIESLLLVEEEPRVIIIEIIEQLIDQYLKLPNYQEEIIMLLTNLQRNLQASDEIESSPIAIFTLMIKLFDALLNKDSTQLKAFQFNLEVFCPFNFHKIINVRFSYNQVIQKCLKYCSFSIDELTTIFRLTLQSLVMERQKSLVKLLLSNLKDLAFIISQINESNTNSQQQQSIYLQVMSSLFQDNVLPEWLYAFEIQRFDSFIFFLSKSFESFNNDYYKIVYRPVTPDEKAEFYFGKMRNMHKVMGILTLNEEIVSNTIISALDQQIMIMINNETEEEDQQQKLMILPLSDTNIINILIKIYNIKNFKGSKISIESLTFISDKYMTDITENEVYIYQYKEISELVRHAQILTSKFEKFNMQDLLCNIQSFNDLLNLSILEQKTLSVGGMQQLISQIDVLLQQQQQNQIQEIDECFASMKLLFNSFIESICILVTRLKSLGATLHIELASLKQIELTTSYNNLLKPLLTSLQEEKIFFLAKLSVKSLVQLFITLQCKNKQKVIQKALSLIIKNIEDYSSSSLPDNNKTLEQGLKLFTYYCVKKVNQNLYKVFDSCFFEAICKYLQEQDFQNWCKLNLFLIKEALRLSDNATEIYQELGVILIGQFDEVINKVHLNDSMPELVLQFFIIFPSQQIRLISILLKLMNQKQTIAFNCLIKLLESMNNDLLKFIPVFIIPIIKNIQYSQQIFPQESNKITQILAQLLQLLPLNLAAISDLAGGKENEMVHELREYAKEGYNFLQVFVNNQMVSEYQMVIPVKANLREYQVQGINWMASLGKYNLNCALCDDMGLGKTIQSLCVILNESHKKEKECNKKQLNLIVCPTTITYNWNLEIKKFFPEFTSIVYEGDKSEKQRILTQRLSTCDILIISYEKLRQDIENFKSIQFFYVVLDEAHIIKNAKSKTTISVKLLKCEKKIILTGTPLQNRVSELWSIFDFLMPGFLEDEQIFNKKYNQYLTSNIKKLQEKLEETQSFLNALKSLKKRISPFILRRTKTDVLKELPPKIIQDYPCQMTKFQDYVHSQVEKKFPIQQTIEQTEKGQKQMGKSILQNLICHRQVCNHPIFVTDKFPDDKSIKNELSRKSKEEHYQYQYSGKLQGLVDLLVECEIIDSKQFEESKKEEAKMQRQSSLNGGGNGGGLGVSFIEDIQIDPSKQDLRKHRALIFCQMTSFMNVIISQILQRYQIKFMSLQSSHSGKQRVEIVQQFNNDESVRVLILTTAVGGLGLNLTGADTVIFAEHDWNPMKDLQAIDRAHRIGQTRTVNVYRLIVSGTIEEKIMSLQRFKENLAKSLVSSRDTSTVDANSLEMTDLLKSFEEHSAFNSQTQMKSLNSQDRVLNNLEEIWKSDFIEDL